MQIVKDESLSQLERRLIANVLTDDDEQRFNVLTEKYASYFGEFVEYYQLEDMQRIFAKIQEVFKKAQIKEYFIQKELMADVEKILERESN